MSFPNTSMPSEEFLWDVFQSINTDGSDSFSAEELQRALSDLIRTSFNPEIVRLIIGMFDKKGTGTVNFSEFGALWKHVTDWQACFETFDRDNSGGIDRNEFQTALVTFGYNLSKPIVDLIVQKYGRAGFDSIFFDGFMQSCLVLRKLTAAFRQHDHDQDGVIKIRFEEFLTMVFGLSL